MEQRMVILYGHSLLLSLVAAGLVNSPNLRVLQAENWDEVAVLALERVPDVLIYDLVGSSDSAILPLLYKNPHLLSIGLDVETNRAFLLTSQETQSLTLERVREIVEKSLVL